MKENTFKILILLLIPIEVISLFGGFYWLNKLHNDYECAQYINEDCVKYCNFNGLAATKINTDCNRLGNIK